mgnify:CR=1 FL=1
MPTAPTIDWASGGASLEQGFDGFPTEPRTVYRCDEYRPASYGSQPTLDTASAPRLGLAIEDDFRVEHLANLP